MKKLLILAVLVSGSFCQNNKPKFNFDKLKDPEPKWPNFFLHHLPQIHLTTQC